jgi:hypothetical protein
MVVYDQAFDVYLGAVSEHAGFAIRTSTDLIHPAPQRARATQLAWCREDPQSNRFRAALKSLLLEGPFGDFARDFRRKLCAQSCRAKAFEFLLKKRKFKIALDWTNLLKAA